MWLQIWAVALDPNGADTIIHGSRFNYIIDEREVRIVALQKMKTRCMRDIMSWESAGCGLATCETWTEKKSGNSENEKQEEIKERARRRASVRNMNKLKWTVMLIISFQAISPRWFLSLLESKQIERNKNWILEISTQQMRTSEGGKKSAIKCTRVSLN